MTEVATFRSDGAYSDGRHPDAVRYTKSAEEDVQRRDFTINGLLLDPLRCWRTPAVMESSSAQVTKCQATWGTRHCASQS